ncbi:ribose 1,5-bisphosphokinase [Alkalimarinus alittae]|uniref:ribose 1,5-bisphosphate phosphokinase n=1 Tax=Alkalimarinus alittae TaxID=2961619 RepID=A0ABY6N2A8_9ALTE|nr:ribose 1,5-bisphosphokinase [Alkalimarinus alittae]UZE96248.1 ribose 1,5-bisphosphokinase [Alkalimarinus alittae]
MAMINEHGRLFYLMGASGSGKDSILSGCRERLSNEGLYRDLRCFIAHRYITRRPELRGENHVWLSDEEFSRRVESQAFSMYWKANNFSYGVGVEVDNWLANGINVILNGSRGYLPSAMEKYSNAIVPVHIHVDPNDLRARLIKRGRESAEEIEKRIERAKKLNEGLGSYVQTIDNNGSLSAAVDSFFDIMNTECCGVTAL